MLHFPSRLTSSESSPSAQPPQQLLFRTLNQLITAWVVKNSANPHETLKGIHEQHEMLKMLEEREKELDLALRVQSMSFISEPSLARPMSGLGISSSFYRSRVISECKHRLDQIHKIKAACFILRSQNPQKPPFQLYLYPQDTKREDIPPLQNTFNDLESKLLKTLKAFKSIVRDQSVEIMRSQEANSLLSNMFFAFDTICQAQKMGMIANADLEILKKIAQVNVIGCRKLQRSLADPRKAENLSCLGSYITITRFMLATIACFYISKDGTDFDLFLADKYLQDCESLAVVKKNGEEFFKRLPDNIGALIKARLAIAEGNDEQFETHYNQIEVTDYVLFAFLKLLEIAAKHFEENSPHKALKLYDTALTIIEKEQHPVFKKNIQSQKENFAKSQAALKEKLAVARAPIVSEKKLAISPSVVEAGESAAVTTSPVSVSKNLNHEAQEPPYHSEKYANRSLQGKVAPTLEPVSPAASPAPILQAKELGFLQRDCAVTPIYSSKCAQKKRKGRIFVCWDGIPKVDGVIEEAFKKMLNPTWEGLLTVGVENEPGPKLWMDPDRIKDWRFCALRFKRKGQAGSFRVVAEPLEKITIKNEEGKEENRYLFGLGRAIHK